jgi:hypothetical protein
MAIIKLLEKTFMLTNVGVPEYCFGRIMEFLGEV